MFRSCVPRALVLLAASILLAPIALPTIAVSRDLSNPFPRLVDTPTWSVAMHIHGSLSEGTGSMEWHSALARQYGLDAIWWTDHDWRVSHTNHTRRFDFEAATYEPSTQAVVEADDAYPGDTRDFRRREAGGAYFQVALVDSLAYEGNRSLRLRAWDIYGNPIFRSFTFNQASSRQHNKWTLAARPHVKFALFPETFDAADSRFVLQFTLSEHPETTPVLRYVIGTMDEEPATSIALPFTAGQWNVYDLDVASDVIARFTAGGADSIRGEDNSLYQIDLIIQVRSEADATVYFDDLRYDPEPGLDGAALMHWSRRVAEYYEQIHPGPKQFVGSEISWFRAQPHLNGYAPSLQLVDYAGHTHADSLWYAIDQVHDQGGAVSLNHLFGTSVYGNSGETEAEKEARILWRKNQLLASRAYGADVFEVGYRWRHGISLEGHARVWDTLTANAIFVTANGVSDSHGTLPFGGWGPWIPGNVFQENNFVTWFHAPTLDEADLVAAMLAGRAYFGDPYAFGWNSEIDLVTTDGFRMGKAVVTDRASHDVVVEIDGLPSGVDVRLLQGEIQDVAPGTYVEPNWLRDEWIPAASGSTFVDTLVVDTSVSSFVRVEVIPVGGEPIAYSNPIHFLTSVPSNGVAGPRVAARLGDLRIVDANGVTLRDASWTNHPAELVLDLDEATVGGGTVTIDCTALGPPTAVIGGGLVSQEYDAGILTLVGFEGLGTETQILWDPVGALPLDAHPTDVALSTGRPNPFGRGLSCEIALPHPSLAMLEVLDVSGRRVSVLVDERREAGVHRVAWDGTGPYGRPVASGVYFLRLRAGGRSITTKAVKLR